MDPKYRSIGPGRRWPTSIGLATTQSLTRGLYVPVGLVAVAAWQHPIVVPSRHHLRWPQCCRREPAPWQKCPRDDRSTSQIRHAAHVTDTKSVFRPPRVLRRSQELEPEAIERS